MGKIVTTILVGLIVISFLVAVRDIYNLATECHKPFTEKDWSDVGYRCYHEGLGKPIAKRVGVLTDEGWRSECRLLCEDEYKELNNPQPNID
jgi:hypothetical protein